MPAKHLFEAIDNNDLEALQALIARGDDLDEMEFHHYQGTPLTHACERGATELVRALLAAGADPNQGLFSLPLASATLNGFSEMVELLIGAGAKLDEADEDGATALWIASSLGFADLARQLVAAGARRDIANQDDLLPADIADENGHHELAAWLVNPESGADDALWQRGHELADAAAREQLELLTSAPAAQASGASQAPAQSLFDVIETNDFAGLQALLAGRPDVDGMDFFHHQASPLGLAASRGATEMVRALLAAGAEPSLCVYNPPLVAAARHGFAEIVELLVGAGADLDATDQSGATALWVTSSLGFADLARSLVKAGARRDIANADGLPPAAIAEANGHAALAKYLTDPDSLTEDSLWTEGRNQAEEAARRHLAEQGNQSSKVVGDGWIIQGGIINHQQNGCTFTQDFPSVAARGERELVEAFLASGLPADWTMYPGERTALMCAARNGEPEIVELLLAHGADPNARTERGGFTALHIAMQEPSARDHVPVVKRLLAAGANPNALDDDHLTPLHMALRHAIPALVEALIEGGADPFRPGPTGLHPADLAPDSGRNVKAITDLLEKAAARS